MASYKVKIEKSTRREDPSMGFDLSERTVTVTAPSYDEGFAAAKALLSKDECIVEFRYVKQ